MSFRLRRAMAAVLFLGLWLSACGTKGPLYLPEEPAENPEQRDED